jgi:hypothetical protein
MGMPLLLTGHSFFAQQSILTGVAISCGIYVTDFMWFSMVFCFAKIFGL